MFSFMMSEERRSELRQEIIAEERADAVPDLEEQASIERERANSRHSMLGESACEWYLSCGRVTRLWLHRGQGEFNADE